MIEKTIKSHDGFELKFGLSDIQQDKPWIALIIPFGLKLKMAIHFFEFFKPHYNIVTWESRNILEDSDRCVNDGEFDIQNHVLDMHQVLCSCPVDKFIMVGYCSGAGLALCAANRYPQMIDKLILLSGEYTLLDEAGCTTQFADEIDSLLSLAAKDEKRLSLVFNKIDSERLDDNSNRPENLDLPFSKLAYFRRYCANYLAYKSVDFQQLARYVAHKTLIVSGERDVQVNIKSSEKIAQLMPNAQMHIDPEADHYGILRPDSNSMVTIWNYLCENR
jgi:pimeloyl-ACP methyl ester carboxylesterase